MNVASVFNWGSWVAASLGHSCSFGLLHVYFVNVYQFEFVLLFPFWFLGVGCEV